MKTIIFILLSFFLLSCEKLEEEKYIGVTTTVSFAYQPDYDEMTFILIQHQIDTEGIIYLHNYPAGTYKLNELCWEHTIDCNWTRITKKPYVTNLILKYVVGNDTITRKITNSKQQISYGDNSFNYVITAGM